MELPAVVQTVWFVLAQRTVVVGAAVVKLVPAPEQQPIRIGLRGRYAKKGMSFSFTATIMLRCYAFQVARLVQPAHHALSAYPTNQVGYKIVIAR